MEVSSGAGMTARPMMRTGTVTAFAGGGFGQFGGPGGRVRFPPLRGMSARGAGGASTAAADDEAWDQTPEVVVDA